MELVKYGVDRSLSRFASFSELQLLCVMPDEVIDLSVELALDVANSETGVFQGISPQFLEFANGL